MREREDENQGYDRKRNPMQQLLPISVASEYRDIDNNSSQFVKMQAISINHIDQLVVICSMTANQGPNDLHNCNHYQILTIRTNA